jgi:hypothetical protein
VRAPRILTWHVHGSYLEALGRTGLEIHLPTLPGAPTGYGGRARLALPANVHDVPADQVRDLEIDAVLFQSPRNLHEDQHRVLSERQRRLPRAYLEHDPPREHPTDTRHPVDDPEITVVHVTHFNALMWDTGSSPVRVIEHGVPEPPPGVAWSGERLRGICVMNDLDSRGRRVGRDLFLAARDEVPIDLLGLRSEALGGLGDVPRSELPALAAGYRFFFHPARYTSLGLAVIEAMLLGMPVVAPATTEIVSVLDDGRSGVISTDPRRLVEGMRELLGDRELAQRIGAAGRDVARARFGMDRFARDWEGFFRELIEGGGAHRRREAA